MAPPYQANIRDFRAYRYQCVRSAQVVRDKSLGKILDMMPMGAIPFSNHPQFDDFYGKLDIVFKMFLQQLAEATHQQIPVVFAPLPLRAHRS